MAISFDNANSVNSGSAFTIGTGTNVMVFMNINTGSATPPATVTLGGVNGIHIDQQQLSAGGCGANFQHYYYFLMGSTNGAQTLVMTGGGSGNMSGYFGVDQVSPIEIYSMNNSTSTSITISLANTWLVTNNNGCSNSTQGGTALGTVRLGTNGTGELITDSNGNKGAGTYTMTSTNNPESVILVSFKTASATVQAGGFFLNMLQN